MSFLDETHFVRVFINFHFDVWKLLMLFCSFYTTSTLAIYLCDFMTVTEWLSAQMTPFL